MRLWHYINHDISLNVLYKFSVRVRMWLVVVDRQDETRHRGETGVAVLWSVRWRRQTARTGLHQKSLAKGRPSGDEIHVAPFPGELPSSNCNCRFIYHPFRRDLPVLLALNNETMIEEKKKGGQGSWSCCVICKHLSIFSWRLIDCILENMCSYSVLENEWIDWMPLMRHVLIAWYPLLFRIGCPV